jgi:hypothetical protein
MAQTTIGIIFRQAFPVAGVRITKLVPFATGFKYQITIRQSPITIVVSCKPWKNELVIGDWRMVIWYF